MGDWPGIFVVGASRSGTTLLRLMLDAHPSLAIPPETHFLRDLLLCRDRETLSADTMCDMIIQTPRWLDYGLDRDALLGTLRSCDQFSVGVGMRAFYRLYAEAKSKPNWGDKTPEHGLILPHIAAVFPDAKFIHLVRDGRDAFLSLKSTWFGQGAEITQHAQSWSRYVQRIDQFGHDCKNFLRIRYEDLVQDPPAILGMLCTFLGLGYTNELLGYHLHAKDRLGELSKFRTSSGRQVSAQERIAAHRLTSSPPDPSRTFRWRREMSKSDACKYVAIASSQLLRLGYGLC